VTYGVIVRVRREMGADIAGACGQLALTNKPSEVNGERFINIYMTL
jgi:adenine C2-methylase RlmN of 23S rRNA A2503 and tRNA A37